MIPAGNLVSSKILRRAGRVQLIDIIVERGLDPIDKLAKDCAFQVRVSSTDVLLPLLLLCDPNHKISCDVFIRIATSSNPRYKSTCEMWYGKKPSPPMLKWVQPCFYGTIHDRKIDAQSTPGYFLGPAT